MVYSLRWALGAEEVEHQLISFRNSLKKVDMLVLQLHFENGCLEKDSLQRILYLMIDQLAFLN